ncbi:MAG: glycoside hydrolase family 16 protein [Bacteroidota bacterium]
MKKHFNLFIKTSLFFAVLFAFSSCVQENSAPERSWTLVWEDNFDGPAGTPIDETYWNFDQGTDWGNAQLEYTTDRTDNIRMDGNGNLEIVARAEGFAGSAYTSGRITTLGKVDQTYGRFEARLKTPFGPGLWPAFWLLGSNCDVEEWPLCGEIDVMELRGQEPSIIHGSVHGPGYSAGDAITNSFTLVNDRFDNDFHVFAVEWGEDYVDYYVDDNLYFRVEPDDLEGNEWVYDHDFHIILNVAVGGNYVGFPAPGTTFPQKMVVDYVRVFRESVQ